MRFFLTFFSITLAISLVYGQSGTLGEYIEEARRHAESGDLEGAIEVMRGTVQEYAEDPEGYTFLGLYLGQSAGEATDPQVKMSRVSEAFEMLDKAVSLDSLNVQARFHRGLMGVKVPEFFGRRGQGIEDLRAVVRISEKEPEKVAEQILVNTYGFLAEVYEERNEVGKAAAAWKKVIEIAPESEASERAEQALTKLSASARKGEEAAERGEDKPGFEARDSKQLVQIGQDYFDRGDYENAEGALMKAIAIDSSNAKAYALLGMTVGMKSARGYDEKIADDTDLRINQTMRSMEYLDKAVELAPQDMEMRLIRGMWGVNFPFFVGKLDQSIADLSRVIESDASDSMKAEALYGLGIAYRKKALTHWLQAIEQSPESEVAKAIFRSMRPRERRVDLSRYDAPIVSVDFVLGFQDEVPPQTAIWIENEAGDFVRTIYVSGFAGHAGSTQIALPGWSASSSYATDATTGASIDVGHYTYVWDLRDSSTQEVSGRKYVVKVEVSYWPSYQYQLVSAPIEVGGEATSVTVEEGNLIPYLNVRYLPTGRE